MQIHIHLVLLHTLFLPHSNLSFLTAHSLQYLCIYAQLPSFPTCADIYAASLQKQEVVSYLNQVDRCYILKFTCFWCQYSAIYSSHTSFNSKDQLDVPCMDYIALSRVAITPMMDANSCNHTISGMYEIVRLCCSLYLCFVEFSQFVTFDNTCMMVASLRSFIVFFFLAVQVCTIHFNFFAAIA